MMIQKKSQVTISFACRMYFIKHKFIHLKTITNCIYRIDKNNDYCKIIWNKVFFFLKLVKLSLKTKKIKRSNLLNLDDKK